MRLFFSFFIAVILLSSCDSGDYIYKENKTINTEGWAYADSLDYKFDIKDTSLVYSLILNVNHTVEYPYQNIYFNISTSFPSGRVLKQPLSSDLANKAGVWYGDCSDKKCIASINLQEKVKFDEIGQHNINIAQYSRDSALAGVKNVELKLMEYKIAE